MMTWSGSCVPFYLDVQAEEKPAADSNGDTPKVNGDATKEPEAQKAVQEDASVPVEAAS